MDAKATLFEGVLIEFNWGQRNQQYRSLDLSAYTPSAERISKEGTLSEQIALYLCWCAHITATDKSRNTGHFTSQPSLVLRNQCVHAILNRMAIDQPNHPALIVLANDCQLAVQKAQGLVFLKTYRNLSGSLKN